MKKIGIIAAMDEEMKAIENIMTDIKEINKLDLSIVEGKIRGKECVLTKCGVGKVNAARTTQILIDRYDFEYIINVGSAGAANDNLKVGDIIIGKSLVQHDFDITAFGHPKGHISNIGTYIESDALLIEKIENIQKNQINDDYTIKIGTIASGDIFCTEPKMKEKIRTKFNADAIEMEGAAIAQVCKLNEIPFIVIRSISDNPNGKNEITFDQFLEKASKRCAEIINKFLN